MRICAVTTCSNSTFHLEKWKQRQCIKHGCHFGFGACDCEPPFYLYTFPTERRDADARRRWIKLINRKDPKTNENWVAKSFDRVCSRHFPDGRPTAAHPDPCLYLGYEPSPGPPSTLRRPPTNSPLNPATEHKRRKKLDSGEIVLAQQGELDVDYAQYTFSHDHNYTCNCQSNCECPGCATTKKGKIQSLEKRVRELHDLVALKVTSKRKPQHKKLLQTPSYTSTNNDLGADLC
ncbi:uncharacterized protein LOC117299508 [Asterias rubens]|uniref:uncharacterized protein LOC117299508 n=1 Tax=Asterias rubens TaxID=7604 RepID=UPI0014554704|nr:uncharacterized protein LOC117299508 [Asterias rubens]